MIWEEPKVGWAQTWYLGGPQGVSITNAANLTKANPWQIVGIGDFNGDGNPDVAWQDRFMEPCRSGTWEARWAIS